MNDTTRELLAAVRERRTDTNELPAPNLAAVNVLVKEMKPGRNT